MLAWLLIAACCAPPTTSPDRGGVIEGIVLNGTSYRVPVADTAVVLRVENQGAWIPVAETTSDGQGRFRFEQLPAGYYLPGANYLGVHYPGVRVSMNGRETAVSQRVIVYDTVTEPSPLVAARHEIDIRAEDGVVTVTETILAANRTLRSYIGAATPTEEPSVTLQLSIPPEFEKVTFEREFFGRQFQLSGQRLETHIPWTPGQRELKFTYRLPLENRHWRFRRLLDLPTEHVRLTIASGRQEAVACNLPSASAPTNSAVGFQFDGSALPAGHAIELELGSLPLPWTAYARGIAVAALLLLMLATSLYMLRRRRTQAAFADATAASRTGQRPRTLPHARRSSVRDLPL